MTPRTALATAVRVLEQLRRDPRTLALIVVVPCLLVALMKGIFAEQPETFQRIGIPLVGLFPLIVMFLITSIAMLRERTSGTLERLMTMPLAKLDLLLGYGIAFALAAAVQASIVAGFSIGALGLDVSGSVALVVLLAVANATLGMALGLFVSAFATTEFQAVQFMPAFLLPQILLCGLIAPRDVMAEWLDTIAGLLPMTYAYDGLSRVADGAGLEGRVLRDLGIVAGVALLSLALGAATLRRRTA